MTKKINAMAKNYYLSVGNITVDLKKSLELNSSYLDGLFGLYHKLDEKDPDYESDKSELEFEIECVINQTRALEQARNLQLNQAEDLN